MKEPTMRVETLNPGGRRRQVVTLWDGPVPVATFQDRDIAQECAAAVNAQRRQQVDEDGVTETLRGCIVRRDAAHV
jgi:hypothetical protein